MKWPRKKDPDPQQCKHPRQDVTFEEYKQQVKEFLVTYRNPWGQMEESGDLDVMMDPAVCDQYLAGWYYQGFKASVAADAWYAAFLYISDEFDCSVPPQGFKTV